MKSPDEKALLKGAQALDINALAVIYDQYSPALYNYAMRLLGDSTQAEDCVAETFSRFLKALRSGQGPKEYLQAYLFRVAHNWITDFYRRHPQIDLELDDDRHIDSLAVPAQADIQIEQKQVRSALRFLTPEQRQVIVLRFFEDMELEEVANAVQKPVGAVKSLQHRAVAALKRLLGDEKEGRYEN